MIPMEVGLYPQPSLTKKLEIHMLILMRHLLTSKTKLLLRMQLLVEIPPILLRMVLQVEILKL